MADERLNILINARNNARGELDSLKGQLSGLNKAADVASGGVMGLAGMLGGAAVAGLVVTAGKAAIELGKTGAASLEMKDSFAQTAQGIGASGAEILAAMRTASAGMVQDTELVASANRAMLMGAADSADEFSKLMEVARVRSDAVGMSVGDAFSSLAEGIGRASERQLYALGINLDLVQVNEEYAASIGKTADKLTEAEKKQSIYNAVIASSAPLVAAAGDSLSDADKIDQAAVAWGNLKNAMAEAFSPAIAASAQFLATQIDAIVNPPAGNYSAEYLTMVTTKLEALQELEARGIELDSAQAAGKQALTAILQQHAASISTASDTTRNLKDDVLLLGTTEGALTGSISAASQALIDQAAKLDIVGGAVAGYIGKLKGMAAGLANVIGTGGALAKLKSEEAQVRRTTAAYEAMGWSQEQIALVTEATGETVADTWQGMIAAPGEAAAAAEVAARRTSSAYTSAVDAVAQKFDELKGKVAGVLSGALNLDVGVNLDDLLPRQDAVNENARRLADIAVNGFKDQSWLEEFKREAPDIAKALQEAADPKTAAALLLRDFQDGLVPQLIDKQTAKDKVRRMIMGEASMAQLATEIAQELSAEMGISMAAATTATQSALGAGGVAALTNSGGTASAAFGAGFDGKPVAGAFVEGLTTATQTALGAGGTAALTDIGGLASAAFGDGFKSEPVADAFVDGLTKAIIEKYGSLEASGQQAGAAWRSGFLEGAAIDVTDALNMPAGQGNAGGGNYNSGGYQGGGSYGSSSLNITVNTGGGYDSGRQAGQGVADELRAQGIR